jgi:hypothetical protein
MYITPARVATMGLGVDLSSMSAAALRSICARATATIDAVCAVPRLPQKHDFRGGIITGERHDWPIDPDERPHPNRVYPNHGPVVSVERFDILVDNTNKVSLDVSGVVINNNGGYLEASTLLLTQYGVFGAGIVPYIGLYQPISETDYTYRYEFVVVDEDAEFVDGKTYQCVNQFWLPSADVVVKVDGETKALTTDYTVEAAEGRIQFVANQTADAVVTVSYTYTLPWEISQAAGLLVANELGESNLRAGGMYGLDALRVTQGGGASVERTRQGARRAGSSAAATTLAQLPADIAALLTGYVFTSYG